MKKVLYILIITLIVSLFPVNAYAKATPEGYCKIAEALFDAGKFQEAIKNYDLAIKLNSKYTLAYIEKGSALSGLGKYNEAIACYDTAIKLAPQDPMPYFYKGMVLYFQGKFDDALKWYDSAAKLGLNSAGLFFERGMALNALNRNEEAIVAYDKAIQIDSKYSEAYYNKGIALHLLGKYEDAIKAQDKAISLNPSFEDAYVSKADSLNWLGKYDEAVKCLDKARQLDPNDYNIDISMGNTYYFRKSYEKAIPYYNKAISKYSKAYNAFTGKGYSLYYLNKYTESIEAFKKAIEINPLNADINYYMSLALFKSGDTKNYLTYLQKAIVLDSSYEYAARKEDAFNSLLTNDEFINIVFDATGLINTEYKNPEILKSGVLSGIRFLDLNTTGSAPEDNSFIQAAKDLENNLYSGNIYNRTTADNCHINKDSLYTNELLQAGRYVKGQLLLGLKMTYEIRAQKILYVGKQQGSIKAAVIEMELAIKYDGQSTNVYAYDVFVLNNGTWEFYGYLNPGA